MLRKMFLLLAILTQCAQAKIPEEYKPIVVEAPFSFSERLFDLTSVVEQANRESKPIYIYLGAEDCPPCKEYYRFLQTNHDKLKTGFDKVLVVDIRTWLRGRAIVFKIGDVRYTVGEFKSKVGDANGILSYPYFWLLSPSLIQLKQLPRGLSNFTSIEKQLEILQLP